MHCEECILAEERETIKLEKKNKGSHMHGKKTYGCEAAKVPIVKVPNVRLDIPEASEPRISLVVIWSIWSPRLTERTKLTTGLPAAPMMDTAFPIGCRKPSRIGIYLR